MNPDDRITYLTAIWYEFQQKAGIKRDWSSAEYHLAAKWADRNIPLAVVFRAFTDFTGRPKRLEAMEGAVDDAQAYYHRAMGLTGEPR